MLAVVVLPLVAVAGIAAHANLIPDTESQRSRLRPDCLNCIDFCQRLSELRGGELCDEDTMSMNYAALADVLVPAVRREAARTRSCRRSSRRANGNASSESSCRQVVDSSYDTSATRRAPTAAPDAPPRGPTGLPR